jgi:hypothetical protein
VEDAPGFMTKTKRITSIAIPPIQDHVLASRIFEDGRESCFGCVIEVVILKEVNDNLLRYKHRSSARDFFRDERDGMILRMA